MIRFIFRKQSTDDLLQASATTDRLYRVAQHHMYASEGALLVRGGQDTAATVTRTYDVRNVTSLYLVDVYDFDRDVPRQLRRFDERSDDGERNGQDGNEGGEHSDNDDDDEQSTGLLSEFMPPITNLKKTTKNQTRELRSPPDSNDATLHRIHSTHILYYN